MTENMTVHYDAKPIYDIVFSDNFDALPELLIQQGFLNRRVCIVTETNVASYYLEELKEKIAPVCKELYSFVFEEGEENKNLKTVQSLYEFLIIHKLDRKDCLIALGGGVVGDLTGFTAATYLRGIDFIQVPTSLLSQVDSSIGGKTGVDFDAYKNMVGAFHMPKLVYTNISTLKTLSDRQFLSGMGEVIKHGLIKDKSYFDYIVDNKEQILTRDIKTMLEVVKISCNIKRQVVEEDPTEQGVRALLNFGHTLGHAIEKLSDFSLCHGECVAIGSDLAAHMSYNMGYLSLEEYKLIHETFVSFGYPEKPNNMLENDIINTTKNDKKMVAGKIKFILLKEIGNAFIDTSVTDSNMSEVL